MLAINDEMNDRQENELVKNGEREEVKATGEENMELLVKLVVSLTIPKSIKIKGNIARCNGSVVL